MIFIEEWQLMLLLAFPIMNNEGTEQPDLVRALHQRSEYDYSRDIMLANTQPDMEAGPAKMQLNKKIALTKSNEDKAASLKKQKYMFLPT